MVRVDRPRCLTDAPTVEGQLAGTVALEAEGDPWAEVAVPLQEHLPGQHDQKSHGRHGGVVASRKSAGGALSYQSDPGRPADAALDDHRIATHFRQGRAPNRAGQGTAKERAALADFNGGLSSIVNDALRHGSPVTDEEREMVRQVDSYMDRTALPQDTMVFRGMASAPAFLGDLKAGDELVDPGYMSASLSPATGKVYGLMEERNMMRIRLPRGSKAIYVPNTPLGIEAEQEMVLPRGSRLRVTGRSKAGMLELELVP